MKLTRVLIGVAALALALASAKQAQAVPSNFSLVQQIFGVHILDAADVDVTNTTPDYLNGGTYHIVVDAGAWIKVNNVVSDITEIHGFYEVFNAEFYDDHDLRAGAVVPSRSNTAGWNDDDVSLLPEDGAGGSAVGFAIQPANGVTPGGSVGDFVFGQADLADDQPNQVFWGFDLGTNPMAFGGGTSPTGLVYLDGSTVINEVPEPAFYQLAGLLALGGLGIRRLRKA